MVFLPRDTAKPKTIVLFEKSHYIYVVYFLDLREESIVIKWLKFKISVGYSIINCLFKLLLFMLKCKTAVVCVVI